MVLYNYIDLLTNGQHVPVYQTTPPTVHGDEIYKLMAELRVRNP